MELRVEDDPDPEDVARLDARIAELTARQTGHDDLAPLAVFARDDDGTLVGGVSGWTWGGCCELQHLWVEPDQRGHGLGTQLLDAMEQAAAARGCGQVVLFTHASNAGRAGRRWTVRGYELVGRVDDYPAGDAALWFRKRL